MPQRNRTLLVLAAAVLISLAAATEASADELTFSNVQGGFYDQNTGVLTYVDLFSNPNHVFTFNGAIIGYGPEQVSYVSFTVGISGLTPSTTQSLRFTFTQTGGNSPTPQTIELTDLGHYFPTGGFGVAAPFTGGFYEGSPHAYAFEGFVTIDIIGIDPDYVIPSGPNAGQTVNSFSFPFRVERVIPVPEPASLVLLGAGLAGVAARVRKLRKSRQVT